MYGDLDTGNLGQVCVEQHLCPMYSEKYLIKKVVGSPIKMVLIIEFWRFGVTLLIIQFCVISIRCLCRMSSEPPGL